MDILSTPELLQRIDALVVHATGLSIEADRMRTDALYARDVLLVCDALQDSEGPALATRFRALQALKNATTGNRAETRHSAVATPGRTERRAKGLRDRRRQRMRPPGRERRRGPRRSAEGERAAASTTPATPAASQAVRKNPPGSRIFSSIFGHTTQPPDEEVVSERAEPAPPRRWFGRRPGPR